MGEARPGDVEPECLQGGGQATNAPAQHAHLSLMRIDGMHASAGIKRSDGSAENDSGAPAVAADFDQRASRRPVEQRPCCRAQEQFCLVVVEPAVDRVDAIKHRLHKRLDLRPALLIAPGASGCCSRYLLPHRLETLLERQARVVHDSGTVRRRRSDAIPVR